MAVRTRRSHGEYSRPHHLAAVTTRRLCSGLDRLAGDLDDLVDLVLLDDQGWRHRERIGRLADHQAHLERLNEGIVPARAHGILAALHVDAGGEPKVADVDDSGDALQRVYAVLPIGGEVGRALEQSFVLVDV